MTFLAPQVRSHSVNNSCLIKIIENEEFIFNIKNNSISFPFFFNYYILFCSM